MSRVAVLGGGIVGTAAAWDLVRRGHDVVVSDRDRTGPRRRQRPAGRSPERSMSRTATPFGSISTDSTPSSRRSPTPSGWTSPPRRSTPATHYLDFGGNPTVVPGNSLSTGPPASAGMAVVPDCGLAPGMANVLAMRSRRRLGRRARSTRCACGWEPFRSHLSGPWGTSWPSVRPDWSTSTPNRARCIVDGGYVTVEPLTGIEQVDWEGWGPLEAFHTAGGSSSLPPAVGGTGAEPRLQDACATRATAAIFRGHARARALRRDPPGGQWDRPSHRPRRGAGSPTFPAVPTTSC